MDQTSITSIVLIILAFILLVLTYSIYFAFFPRKEFNVVRFISRIAIFGAMAAILYAVPYFKLKVPFFPSFLEFHFDEIPAFICGFAYGPFSGFCVLLIKTLIKLPMSTTGTVGEFSDLALSTIYVVIVTFVYSKKRNLKGVLIGFSIGTVIQLVAAMVLNVYVLVPLYLSSPLLNITEKDLLYVMRLAIPSIKDIKWSYASVAVLPFNAMKDGIVIVITFFVYRSIHYFLRFEKR